MKKELSLVFQIDKNRKINLFNFIETDNLDSLIDAIEEIKINVEEKYNYDLVSIKLFDVKRGEIK